MTRADGPRVRLFLVNFETNDGTAGEGGLSVVRTVERVGEEIGTRFIDVGRPVDRRGRHE